jgi:hypothetical protein
MTKVAVDATWLKYKMAARQCAGRFRGETIPMRVLERLLTICGVALVAISLGVAQPALAGDGGEDFGSLQSYIGPPDGSGGLCSYFGMNPCPQLPTLTQAILEVAGLTNAAPEMVRSGFSVTEGNHVDAGNPSRPPAVNPVTGFPVASSVLSTLKPLAFISATNGKGTAIATRLGDPAANAFFYAVGGTSVAGASQPDTLYLFYDEPTQTNGAFQQGRVIAKISLPLTVRNQDGTERAVPAVVSLKSSGSSGAPCSITGNFSGSATQTLPAATIGVNCAVVFGTSPASPYTHAVFEVAVPLLITASTDPAYPVSANPVSFALPPIFTSDDIGSAPASLNGGSIGIAPTAGPLGVPSTTIAASYPLCASLPRNTSGQNLVSSVAAFYAIATDGEVLLSAPMVPSAPGIVCPAGM